MTERLLPLRNSAATLYDVLQVSPTASQEVIHAAYRTLARGFHPDVNPTVDAAEHMQRLNEAYQVLGDQGRRADYDLRLARATRPIPSAFVTATHPTHPTTVGVRGKPRPDSPRRIEDERAARRHEARTATSGSSASVRTRPRLVIFVAVVVIFAVALTTLFWLTSMMLDEVPDAAISFSAPAHAAPKYWAAQPFLNHG